MQLFKNILYSILSIQEAFLRKRLSRTIGVKNTSKSKTHYYSGFTVTLSSMAEEEKANLEAELTLLLKKFDYEPQSLLKYIEQQGTKVLYIDNAAKILNPIGENEGFIYPASGTKALYISLAAEKTPKLKTDEMFILSRGNINKYYFIYHFYNWYAFKHNIAGLDPESQKLLKKFLFENSDTKTLQLSEIYKLKDAISQDKAAIEFVIKLCRNYEGTKQALEKMHNEGSARL